MSSSASTRAVRLFSSSDLWVRSSSWVLAGCLGWLAVQELLKLYWSSVARRRNSALASPTELVRLTTREVLANAQLVSVSRTAVLRLAKNMTAQDLAEMTSPAAFDASIHFCDGTWRTVQYLLVVDCLNFCFWPYGPGLEYEHLACGLKRHIEQHGIGAISAEQLAVATKDDVRAFFGAKGPLPQEEERARLLREVGAVLLTHYGGRAANLVLAAKRSAPRLVALLAAHLPGFRDHAVYNGRQVFFYKRAQIFVGDVHGAFRGAGLGAFADISALTMFADYRVPVVLRNLDVLRYEPALAAQIDSKVEIAPGSAAEVEIRAGCIQAVELLKESVGKVHGPECVPTSVQLDWWLWAAGERSRGHDPHHHRTHTIYY